jgi:dTDP-4-dehydrorhamnose 3,5-epimerase
LRRFKELSIDAPNTSAVAVERQKLMEFQFVPQVIPAVVLVKHEEFRDDRGLFTETFREANFLRAGLPRFVQDSQSVSKRGVLRGLHYQTNPAAVGKLVRCLKGTIWDVAVDIRKGSPTYAEYVAVELSDSSRSMLYVPPGFAHGFVALSDGAEVFYKMTEYYSPPHDRAMRWNDPAIAIDWPTKEPILSQKDINAPLLAEADNNFIHQN